MPVDELPKCDYCVMVRRSQDRPDVGLWPITMREKLPEIPVPLTGENEFVVLDLQAALQASFKAAGYAGYIYRENPEPPLDEMHSQWAESIVATIGN